MARYLEVVLGAKTNRGVYIESTPENLELERQKALKLKLELYRSYYEYSEEILEHARVAKTPAGFKGTIHLPFIVLDIDSHVNTLLHSWHRVRAILEGDFPWLDTKNNVAVWFSGRGFHLHIPDIFGFTDGELLHETVEATLKHYFPDCDAIYAKSQLIRVGNTWNAKAGRYKVFHTQEELYGTPEKELEAYLKATSIAPRQLDDGLEISSSLHVTHPELIVQPRGKLSAARFPVLARTTAEVKQTGNYVSCMQRLYSQGPGEEGRHKGILRLASAWRRAGLPYDAVSDLMVSWAGTLDHEEVRRTVRSVYEKGYRFSCHDEIMTKYCQSHCVFFNAKNYVTPMMEGQDLHKRLETFYLTSHESSLNLRDLYTLPDDFMIFPGELVIFWGDTGVGKSAFVQNILLNTGGRKAVIWTTEFGVRLYSRRLLQIAHGMTKDVVEAKIRSGYDAAFWKPLMHLKISQVSPDLTTIVRVIREEQPKIIVLDVIDGISHFIKETYARETDLAKQLKQMAENHNVIILGVHHISKHAAVDEKGQQRRIHVHSGKGSSALEDNADKVIGIEGMQGATARTIRSLKARDETPFTIICDQDMDTFQFKQKISQFILTTAR